MLVSDIQQSDSVIHIHILPADFLIKLSFLLSNTAHSFTPQNPHSSFDPALFISWEWDLCIEWVGFHLGRAGEEFFFFFFFCYTVQHLGLPQWLSSKESACDAGDTGNTCLIPGSGRSSAEGHSNPLQYLCLGNPKDRGAWKAIVHGVAKNQTRLRD